MNKRVIEGYRFCSDEDYKMAEEELKKINHITSKLDVRNYNAVLQVYDKCIKGSVFITPVGIDFMKGMQNYLIKSGVIPENEIMPIPLKFSYNDALILHQNKRYDSLDNKEKKDYRQGFVFSLLVNIVLVITVALMFVMVLTADTPNMINYKNAVENKYAEWEQDLSERENIIREKEAELKLRNGE